jgi:hypothetical protein
MSKMKMMMMMTSCIELRISMMRMRHTSPISVSKCSSDRSKVEDLPVPVCKNRKEIVVRKFWLLRKNWLTWTFDLIVSIIISYWTRTLSLKKNSSRDLQEPNNKKNQSGLNQSMMMRMITGTRSRTNSRMTTTVRSSTNNKRDNKEEI